MIGVWLIFIKKVLSIVPMNVVLGFIVSASRSLGDTQNDERDR